MGLPPAHLVVYDGFQILVEPLIGHQTIVVVFNIEFVLHGLMQSVLDGFSHQLFRHNFVALFPVGL